MWTYIKGATCEGLNYNGPYGKIYLQIWSTVGRTLLEGLERSWGMALFEKKCH